MNEGTDTYLPNPVYDALAAGIAARLPAEDPALPLLTPLERARLILADSGTFSMRVRDDLVAMGELAPQPSPAARRVVRALGRTRRLVQRSFDVMAFAALAAVAQTSGATAKVLAFTSFFPDLIEFL